jgi:hypothetical protein
VQYGPGYCSAKLTTRIPESSRSIDESLRDLVVVGDRPQNPTVAEQISDSRIFR